MSENDEHLRELEAENTRLKSQLTELNDHYNKRVRHSKVSWGLWIAGSIIVALSWINVVDGTTGWLGWGLALCGTLWGTMSNLDDQNSSVENPDK